MSKWLRGMALAVVFAVSGFPGALLRADRPAVTASGGHSQSPPSRAGRLWAESARYAVRVGWMGRGEMAHSLAPVDFEGRPVWYASRIVKMGSRGQKEESWFSRRELKPLRYRRRLNLADGRQRVDEVYWDRIGGELLLEERIEKEGAVVDLKSREVWRLGERVPETTADPLCLWWRFRAALSVTPSAVLLSNGSAVVSVDDVFDWRMSSKKGKGGGVVVEEHLEAWGRGGDDQSQIMTVDLSRSGVPVSGRAQLWGLEVKLRLLSVDQKP